MYQCERILGPVRGAAVHKLVEAAINDLCPCKRGDPCPIGSPADRRLVLDVPAALAGDVLRAQSG